MKQFNFEQMNDMAKKFQAPMQELTELGMKTMQGFAFIKPDELAGIKKPDELFEKQMKLVLENGRKALDYVQKSYDIMEKSFKVMLDDVKAKDKK